MDEEITELYGHFIEVFFKGFGYDLLAFPK
jgi:hypothetical protein